MPWAPLLCELASLRDPVVGFEGRAGRKMNGNTEQPPPDTIIGERGTEGDGIRTFSQIWNQQHLLRVRQG